MLKGFRAFILRGNIVDLAIAVVIGTAFADLVMQFNQSFLTPLIAVFTGGGDVGGKFVVLSQEFSYGAFIGAVITFLITAAVVYFLVVLPMKKLLGRTPQDASESEAQLLTEIRDLLRAQEQV
ncbi:MAG: large conductance mechanosensitive channel protein MscL [Pseudonocardiales bacterium]